MTPQDSSVLGQHCHRLTGTTRTWISNYCFDIWYITNADYWLTFYDSTAKSRYHGILFGIRQHWSSMKLTHVWQTVVDTAVRKTEQKTLFFLRSTPIDKQTSLLNKNLTLSKMFSYRSLF